MLKELTENVGAVLALAGDPPRGLAAQLAKQCLSGGKKPLIVAADGGALHLRELGLTPDAILSDGDSLAPELFPAVRRVDYPRAKDFTDGEAALIYTAENSRGDILILGALGKELDHELANICLPLLLGAEAERCLLAGSDMLAGYCLGSTVICGSPGDRVSLLPLGDKAEGISLSGMVYGLENYDLPLGSSRCIRNELAETQASVTVKKGRLLVLHYPQDLS